MVTKFSYVLAGIFFFSGLVHAQTSSTSLGAATSGEISTADGSSSSTLKNALENKKFDDNHEITDAKLRADAGSLSKYSLSFNLSYFGPALSDLSAKDQPNPDGTVGTYETALSGTFGGRYRIDPITSISLGTGMKAIHPLNGMDRFDVNNPYVSYDMMSRWGNLQMRNSPGVSWVTIPNYTKVGEYGSMNYDFSAVYNLGYSPWALGLDSTLGYYLYSRGFITSDKRCAQYNISAYPNVKYNFSDRFNMYTSVGVSGWNPRMLPDNHFAIWSRSVTQRLGVGYAFRRDVYVAPYLNFYPSHPGPDGTTINVTTVFSLL